MNDAVSRLKETLSQSYVFERELGGGGMSRVFLAREIALGREVVIKMLTPDLSKDVSAERFAREIQVAASLQQANIVPLLATGSAAGVPYYVMPYVPGESLRARLGEQPRLSIPVCVGILRDVARALNYAHAHGVVHRDIKPENILLSGDTAVVTDFGIAKAVAVARTAGEQSTLTQTGTSLGTPAYMAPEQIAGDPTVDNRADIYAWGIVAWEILGGKHPFGDRATPHAMVAAHMSSAAPSVHTVRPDTPAELSDLIRRCLEKDPSRRPDSAAEILQTLDSARSRPTWRRSTLVWSSAAALVATAALLGGLYFMRARSTASPAAANTSDSKSIAVLPIEILGGDSTTQYLADGMTGELSGALTKIQGLQVTPDLSASRFKGEHVDPVDIAHRLGVRMLLTGKLQPDRDRVRLQMQLINSDGKLVWSNAYDRALKDNFAMQDEITGAIASEMRVVLTPAALAVERAGRTENPEAHDLLMRGQFEKNKLTLEGLSRALTYFQDALKLDPEYARAYAGIAFVYDIEADTYAPSHEYHTLALKAARRAVQIDSMLAEARVVYGFETAAANWDFERGRAEMERGLALNPRSADALLMLGTFEFLSGDTEGAVKLADRLSEIDPLSPIGPQLRASALLFGGRYQEALDQGRVANKIDPTVMLIDDTEGNALRELGRLDESLASFLAFEKSFSAPTFGLPITYARMGRRDDALRAIHAMEQREQKQWLDPDFIAIAYSGIGDRDDAMKWLEKAYTMKTYGLRLFMNWDMPFLRGMQGDPRFVALRKRVLATTFTE